MVLAALPDMLNAIVNDAVQAQSDMVIVGSFGTCAEVLSSSSPIGADVVVMGMARDALAPACDDVLFALGRARCLAITNDGKESFLYEFLPRRQAVGALSLDDLLSVIRGDSPPTVPQRP